MTPDELKDYNRRRQRDSAIKKLDAIIDAVWEYALTLDSSHEDYHKALNAYYNLCQVKPK